MSRFTADAVLLLITVFWGGTFPVIKVLVQGLPTNFLLAVRFSLAFVAMAPFVLYRRSWSKNVFWPGIYLGVVLWGGYAFQTWGLRYTTASKAGFLTGLSVLMVPGMSAIFLRKRPSRAVVMGAFCAALGIGFLSMDASVWYRLEFGDILILGCAFLYALQIVLVDRYTSRADSLQLAWVEIGTVAVLSGFLAFRWEPVPSLTGGIWLGLLYLSLLATAFAQVAQITVQKYTTPSRVALVLSLEPVFAAVFAGLFLAEKLTGSQLLGGALVLSGIIVAELDPWRRRDAKSSCA